MKKVLLFLLAFICVAMAGKVNAQCTISNVTITPKSTVPDISGCVVTVDLSYTVALNGGSKHTIIHLWEASNYPSPKHVQSDYPLKSAQTGTMIGTIVLDYQSGTPVVLGSWPTGPGEFKSSTIPTTPILTPQVTTGASGTSTVVTFSNLQLHLSDCGQAITLKGDLWATQNDQNASCLASEAISVVANEPVMTGLMHCTDPLRTFDASFKTLQNAEITFSAYQDVNGNGVYDETDINAGKLQLSGGSLNNSDPNISVSGGTDVTIQTTGGATFNLSGISYTPQTGGTAWSIFIVARRTGNSYDNVLRIDNSCALLPVTFSSFNAARKNQTSVALTWETSFEQNNKGFYVQRNTNGEWKNVAFVFTSADGGNSSQTLRYAYNDPNNLNSISYYRIQQVDIDGRARLSEVRAVRGEEQASKMMLFPNPGSGGKVNVLFNDEAAAKDVMVYDATGRVVKSFKSVSGNSLSINGLKPGMYSLQVTNVASATTSSEKFIIQN